jgi:tetratricopeptide (TPR) repeat protein/tRNA A-37 threonylcarbamoyl transferase component Bud32
VNDWDKVEELFQTVAGLPPERRTAFLDAACSGDSELRAEVDSLLEADTKSGAGIVAAIETAAQEMVGVDGAAGTRLGAYRIVREIGRGGMGTVYLGVRDDDHFKMQVAVKLIRRGLDTQDVLDRFRHERQILASLQHPFIARLLDGGTSPDDRPFLVMEFVHGEPLDQYCRVHDLSLRDRCRLFLKVCEAVAFAHRNLVVHRDLKPGNILVTQDGSPKLLDFGVAKLLDPETDSGRTQTAVALRRITLEYASPEQIRAQQMTTAADVYSLGVVLYELLSGKRPHQFSNYSPREIERVICEADPPRLSEAAPKLRKQLSGDLEAIVAKAMRKEPQLRYASVEQFAADLERYIAGEEVSARQGNFAYRARKFLRRNATGMAFAAVLLTGTVIATREAVLAARAQVRAEQERRRAVDNEERAKASQREAEALARDALDERTTADLERREAETQRAAAETQRQIAEHRFGQVHQLAGKFLFEFHDSIAKLPGSTPARKMVVETGLQYYDGLVRDAQGNRELLEQIARGYDRMGDVQGNPYYANLGDLAGALASYRKALDVRRTISDPAPDFLRDRINGHTKIAQILTAQGNMKDAERYLKEAVAMAGEGPAAADYKVREALAGAFNTYGALKLSQASYGEAEQPLLKLLEISEQLAGERRDPVSEQAGVSLAHTKLGDVYGRMDRNREALDHLRIALDIDKRLASAEPDNLPRTRKLYITYIMLGRALRGRNGDQLAAPGETEEVLNAAAGLADKMLASDPKNNLAIVDVVNARSPQGDWLRKQGKIEDALAAYRKAIDAAVRLDGSNAAYSSLDALVQVHQRYGAALVDAKRGDDAMTYLRRADEYLARAEKLNPGTNRGRIRKAEILETTAQLRVAQKQWSDAIASYRAVISIFESQRARDPKNESLLAEQPSLYARLADCYSATGQKAEAIQALRTALDRTSEIEARRPLFREEQESRQASLEKLSAWR